MVAHGDLLQNIPGFLEDLPIDKIPQGLMKNKATATVSQNICSLSLVVHTTLIEEPRKDLVPGWSSKKTKKENIRNMGKKKYVKHEVGNINPYQKRSKKNITNNIIVYHNTACYFISLTYGWKSYLNWVLDQKRFTRTAITSTWLNTYKIQLPFKFAMASNSCHAIQSEW